MASTSLPPSSSSAHCHLSTPPPVIDTSLPYRQQGSYPPGCRGSGSALRLSCCLLCLPPSPPFSCIPLVLRLHGVPIDCHCGCPYGGRRWPRAAAANTNADRQAVVGESPQQTHNTPAQHPCSPPLSLQPLRVCARVCMCVCVCAGSVLSAVRGSRLSNGLRHDDHLRYRRYCSRRLARLRSSLSWTAGPKAAVRPRPLPSPLPSALFLTLLLTQAERSWAFAQQLAGERSEDTPRKRFHQLKRLKRAVEFASQLEAACQQVADARTQLQAEAYKADMQGSYAFEKGEFDSALQHFLHAKAVYTQLGQVGGSDLAALCDERLAHQQDSIRMSRYFQRQQSKATGAGSGRGGAHEGDDADDDEGDSGGEGLVDSALSSSSSSSLLSSKLQLLVQEREKAKAKSLDTVQFLGRTLPVRNEKARVVLVRLQSMQEEVDRRKRSTERSRAAATATAGEGRGGGGEGRAEAEGGAAGGRGGGADAAESADEEVDGQRSVTGLYQQMANALDDLLRIAKEDHHDAVRHTPHSTHRTPHTPRTLPQLHPIPAVERAPHAGLTLCPVHLLLSSSPSPICPCRACRGWRSTDSSCLHCSPTPPSSHHSSALHTSRTSCHQPHRLLLHCTRSCCSLLWLLRVAGRRGVWQPATPCWPPPCARPTW